MKNKWLILWLIFVAASYLLPWWGKVYFLWDDIELLMQLRNPTPATFFSSHQYQFFPVFQFFYWLQIQIFGVSPGAFLLTSTAIHLTNIYLVFLIIENLTKNYRLAFLASILVSFNKSYFTIIFWPTIQSNLLLTSFVLLCFYLFFKLYRKYRPTTLIAFTAALLLAGLSFGFGIASGFIFAAAAFLFWKKSPARSRTILAGLISGLIAVILTLLFSSAEIRKDKIFLLSHERIFNIFYFTSVGVSQGIITRFFLPGFIPNIYSFINIIIMIAIPTAVLFFLIKTLIANRKQPQALAPLFLFACFTAIPYFIASLARSGPGALSGLAERYIYLPFFSFILTLNYCLFLLAKNYKLIIYRRLLSMKIILWGLIFILSFGHQFIMHLNTYYVFR